MNILDKTNKSQAPVFGNLNNQTPKREKFSWARPSAPGVFLMVRKEDLNIDGIYQRDEHSEKKSRKIASEWDWRLFGVLCVGLRPDGTLWVYDGGHRTRASFWRDDITELPCMVFEMNCLADEARAFLGTNLLKTFVSAYHNHRAAVLCKEPVAQAVAAILQKYGYTTATQAGKSEIAAISTLARMVKEDVAIAEKVFAACVFIAGSNQDPISGDVLEGLFRCQRKLGVKADILTNGHLEKLAKETLPGIEAAIRREKHIVGKGGALIAARAILDLLNKGKRRRITWG